MRSAAGQGRHENMATKLTHPLKWWGGKSYLAKRIIDLMRPHLHFVEPYFGGGAVLLEKDPEGVSEVMNDIDGELMNFWRVLRSETDYRDFQRIISATPFSQPLWDDVKIASEDFLRGDFPESLADEIDRAVWFFVRCRQSRAGQGQSPAPITRNRTRRGMNEQVSAWLSAVEGLPAIHARLKRVLILCRDALDVIRQQDGPKTLFYLDPPYLPQTRVSQDAYQHDMNDWDHILLLKQLSKIQGQFLLSGYPSTLYDAFAAEHGWRCETIQIPNHAAGGRTKRQMTECVWMNY